MLKYYFLLASRCYLSKCIYFGEELAASGLDNAILLATKAAQQHSHSGMILSLLALLSETLFWIPYAPTQYPSKALLHLRHWPALHLLMPIWEHPWEQFGLMILHSTKPTYTLLPFWIPICLCLLMSKCCLVQLSPLKNDNHKIYCKSRLKKALLPAWDRQDFFLLLHGSMVQFRRFFSAKAIVSC